MRRRAAAHWIVVAAPLMLLAPSSVRAQEREPAMAELAEAVLESLDPDFDENVTRSEFLAALAEPDRAGGGAAFDAADADRDGKLSEKEFVTLPPPILFRLLDRDHNGELSSIDEIVPAPALLPGQPAAPPRSAWSLLRSRLAFERVDVDRSGAISEKEFVESPFAPSLAGNDSQSPIPDAVLEEVERVLSITLPPGQESIVSESWKSAPWSELGPDWTAVVQQNPDSNGDGQISRAEARMTVEVSLGVRLPDGLATRLPSGLVFKNFEFGHLDENKDRKLTADEYVAKFKPDREAALENFARMDQDKDGFLTPAEAVSRMRDDMLGTFLRFDVDRDGKVTPEEISRNSQSWEKVTVTGLFPGYDQDGNGSLSFREFAWTPPQSRVIDWNRRRRDFNGDMKLSFDEFRPGPGPFAEVLMRRAFRLCDRDRDGFLSYDEFPFDRDVSKIPAEVAFQQLDRDGDGELTHAEVFLRQGPDAQDPVAVREHYERVIRSRAAFAAMDADRNGQLSKGEYDGRYRLSLSGGSAAEAIPDPVLEEAERAIGLVLSGRTALRVDDWKVFDWKSVGPDWAHLGQANPDADKDGSVTADEARRVLETALGIRRADGTVIRLPTGHLLRNLDLRTLDVNGDNRLTVEEYLAKWQPDRDVAIRRFSQHMDRNKDGFATLDELVLSFREDLVATFARFDTDRDGKVTPDEIARNSADWEKNAVRGLFPGFDQDQDGTLSLTEFGWTPVLNRVLDWNLLRSDVNGDARLSFEEFRPSAELFGSVLARRLFRLRDRNRDGALSLEEFPFTIDPAAVSPEVAFRTRDLNADGAWTFEEALARPAPIADDAEGLKAYDYARLRSRLAFDAVDADRNGTVSLDELRRSPCGRTLQGAWGHPLPDVLGEEAERVLAILLPDHQESIATEAWSRAKWGDLGNDWATLATHKPDRNGDGKISRDEARQAIESALGIRLDDGTLIRLPTGVALKRVEFSHMDANKDGKLSLAEYSKKSPLDPETTSKNFTAMDQNKDGLLTPAEAITRMRDDSVATFLRFDADRDGRITPDELTRHTGAWEKNAALGLFPGFDQDADGALSYREFGWTPLQVRAQDWNQLRKDYNSDLKLSFEEFRLHPDLFASVLTRKAFRLRDVDRNGVLTYDEFPFEMDPARAPPEIAFKTRDRNGDGAWNFDEAFDRPAPKPDDAEGLKAYRYSLLRTRLAFDASDADRNGTVSLNELERSPYGRTLQGAWGYPVPDAILDEVERGLAVLLPDASASITVEGWSKADWAALGPDWVTLAQQKPDRDGDQKVSRDEARQLIEVAFGVRLADGTLIRQPAGTSFKVLEFGWLDTNKDRKLTQGEYAAKFQPSPEVALKNFTTLDQNKDGFLTPAEAAGMMRDDLIGAFLRYDADHDGRVSPREVKDQSSEWEQNLIPGLFPGFDEDGDGSLSYREFCWTPLQTRVVDWNHRRKDYNGDTKLSYEEFCLHPDLFASVLMRKAFRLRDLNRDGFLTYEEFPFDVDSRGLPKQIAFEQKDQNRDGHLTFSETFTQPRPQGPAVTNEALRYHHARRTRCLLAFRATDRDSNGKLSSDEFVSSDYALSSLGDVPIGPVPDPVLQLAERVLSEVFPGGMTSVTKEEWQGFSWQQFGPDWEGGEIAAARADRDGDGVVSREEASETIEIALGIRLTDGTRIRLPTGHLFKNLDFGYLDENKDRKLTVSEYLSKFQPSRDVALKKFSQLDSDQDQLLTPAELVSAMRDDLIGTWTYFDTNFDGRVTPAELASQTRSWEKNTVDGLFPGFDENHDGDLSYEEFALTPVQNRVLNWNRRRRDTDNDTYLSYKEFRGSDGGLFASILMKRFFRLRDQNGDGRLSIDEYSFDMDASKLPIEIAFKVQDTDKDGKLSLMEIFTDPKPKGGDKVELERYEMRLAAAETRFLADDKDHDRTLSPAEFQQSREAALAAVERKTQALTRHRRVSSGSGGGWFFPSVLAVNAVVLLAGGWYLMRRTG